MDWIDLSTFGPLADPRILEEGRIPVPSEHSPRKEMLVHKDGTVTVMESENKNGWIRGESIEINQ